MELRQLRSGFSSTFWIANTLELFERVAFYGSKAVLTVFLATKVGLQEEAGTLAGIFSGVIYSLPIVAGVLVDKYGFRKTLIACFAIFCVGYFLIGMAGLQFGEEIVATLGKRNYMLFVLLLTAVGGSLIKPCIVGTVSKTSAPDKKALGFSIYYSLVNFGGMLGPLLALQVRQNLGIEYVLIQVKDSGGGIPAEDLPRVFTRLYRADNVLIQGVGDTGVGLSIAKTLTEAQKGRIWVDTEPGTGATFSVLLPIAKNVPARIAER